MSSQCNICKQTDSCYTLQFDPEDTDAGEAFTVPICGSCWEIIAKIANLALNKRITLLENKLKQLEARARRIAFINDLDVLG